MDRDRQIRAIIDFVSRHPESLASRTIRRQVVKPEEYATDEITMGLSEGLEAVDEETLTGFFYLVR